MTYPTLGTVARFHRERAGLSRRALSELAGVSETAIYDVEHDKSTVQLQTVVLLFNVLNVQLRYESPLMPLLLAPNPS